MRVTATFNRVLGIPGGVVTSVVIADGEIVVGGWLVDATRRQDHRSDVDACVVGGNRSDRGPTGQG
jgi:hypothetical protein